MELIDRNCKVCYSNDSEKIFEQVYNFIPGKDEKIYTQVIELCRKCGFTYVNPTPSDEELYEYYSNYSNYENPHLKGKSSLNDQKKIQRTYDLIEARCMTDFQGKVLEIGCATGYGLNIFKTKGWYVLGIDPSKNCRIIAKNLYDIEVIEGIFDLGIISKYEPFDVIIISHVLEHLISPDQLVKEIKKIISPNGLVYVEVPNIQIPNIPSGYFTFEHLNYFSPTTLSNMMEFNGYGKIQLDLFDNSDGTTPQYPVIVGLFKKNIKKNLVEMKSDYQKTREVIENHKKISANEIYKQNKKLKKIIEYAGKKRLGIWGAGIHTSQLLTNTCLTDEYVKYIFDNDQKKHGQNICNTKVISLGDPLKLKNEIDAILISSKASENEIYQQIKFLENYGIKIFRLYTDEIF